MVVSFVCHLQAVKCGLLAGKLHHVSGLLQKLVPQSESQLWPFVAMIQLQKASGPPYSNA